MSFIEDTLNSEINWRSEEISIVKTIPFLLPFSEQQKEIWKKHTIPIFYSLWEGFVSESFRVYAHQINDLKIPKDQLCISLLVHSIDTHLALRKSRTDFKAQISFVEGLPNQLNGLADIPVKIPTESLINY